MSSGIYGTSLYGSGIYGAAGAVSWSVQIKWDGSNFIDEAPQLMELRCTRGRKRMLRGANGFEPVSIGELVLTFRNHDGRYDPLNSSSDIYPDVAPGAEVRVRAIGDGGAYYDVFRGHIYDIKPIGNAQTRRVQIIVRDGWQWLKDRKVRAATELAYPTGSAIANIADGAEYPFLTNIDEGNDTIPFWWASDRDALTEMQSVADSEFGLLGIAGDGRLLFRERSEQWGLSATHTLTGLNINEINFAQPWDVIRNVIQVRTYPTEVRTGQVLWRAQGPIRVRAGRTKTLTVEFNLQTAQDQTGLAINVRAPANTLIAPAPNNDYTAFENADGTGTIGTGSINVSVTNLGDSAQIALENTSDRNLYILGLKLRGAVIIKNNPVAVEYDVSGSDSPRSFVLDVPWQQDLETAELYAVYLASFLSDPRAAPVIRTNIAGLAAQCAELFTGFQVDIADLGIDKLYRLAGVEHRWGALSPNVLDTVLYLERGDENTYFVLDTSELNGSDLLAY